jgi:DNA-binding transcriptional regulator YiaG
MSKIIGLEKSAHFAKNRLTFPRARRTYNRMIDKDIIKATRERYGWSQQQLADYLGLNRSNVSRMENGESEPSGPAKKLLRPWIDDAPPFRSVETSLSPSPIKQAGVTR